MKPTRAHGSIEGFDGLRAIAALTVVSYHVALRSGLTHAAWFAPAMWELKGGVAIFFVISGALLYLPYARALRDGSQLPAWRSYARRRGVRILPAYWVAVTAVAFGPFRAGVLGADAWRYYGLSQIYSRHTLLGGLGVAWSLCVEMTFYLLLPLFAWSMARLVARRGRQDAGRVQLAVIGVIAAGSLALRLALAGSPAASTSGATAMVALPGLLDWFAVGMALAVLRTALELGRPMNGVAATLARRPGLCVLLALAVFALALPTQGNDAFLPWYSLETHLAIGLGAGLLVLSVIAPQPRDGSRGLAGLLGHPWLAWVGTISYGVYLWHLPAIELIAPHLEPSVPSGSLGPAAVMWCAALAASIALGAASWYLVERPAQRVFRGRGRSPADGRAPGHVVEIGAPVHSTLDPLNPAGVTVDHLA